MRGTGAQAVLDWYRHIDDEMRDAGYDAREREMMRDPVMYYGRVLDPRTRAYSLSAVSRNFGKAIDFLRPWDAPAPPRLLDLGCGLGQHSLLLASLGADVLGVDLDPACAALATKRKAYYERRLGRTLPVRFQQCRFPQDAAALGGPFDLVFSYSAFMHMTPIDETVRALAGLIRPGGRFFLWDINSRAPGLARSHYARSLPTPDETRATLERHGFRVDATAGGVAVPRQLWRVAPLRWLWPMIDAAAPVGLSVNFTLAAHRAA